MLQRSSYRILLALALIVPGLAYVDTSVACDFAADRIVAAKTAAALPEPLATFYTTRLDALTERAVEPGGAWMRDPGMKSREPWHRLMLDVTAPEKCTHADRMAAAASFPAKQSEAKALFRKHDAKNAGKLIWALDELVTGLSDAMRGRDEDAIIRTTGYIVHFATDAANPFHATRNQRGQETGNLIFGDCVMGDPLFAHQDVCKRIGWELVARNAERYSDSIDPRDIRFDIVEDVPFETLERMVEAIDSLEMLCDTDRSILAEMQVGDGVTMFARHDEYYELLDSACGAVAVENLRRGVRLATTLVFTAWMRAGSPESLSGGTPTEAGQTQVANGSEAAPDRPMVDRGQPPASDKPKEAPPLDLVASKNSKVFHLSSCPHAQRISQDNMVRFGSAEEAIASGRRPCRSCKPAESGGSAVDNP